MTKPYLPALRSLLLILLVPALSACFGGSSSRSNPIATVASTPEATIEAPVVPGTPPGTPPPSPPPVTPPAREGRTYLISPGDSATRDMIAAMVQAGPGDIIQFECGYFELTAALQIINNEDITIKGCGRDQTVLSFKQSNTPEGILGVNVHGLWIEDLTVLDTGGNGFELRGVDHARLSRVRAIWSSGGGRESPDPITAANVFENDSARLNVACTDPATQDPSAFENGGGDTTSPDYTVSPKSGRYGIYPVSSENILVEDSESVGASDAGIYVGQTNTAIIRNSRAAYNVFGFEIENVRGGEYDSNIAECNTGGFLIYDLDGLRQYGDRSRMHGNISRNNNTYNFTSGGIVGDVPPGSGMITLSYDRIDVFDNVFENNNTAGIIHTSYEIFPEGAGRPSERQIDWYTEGVHIFRNTFRNNGNRLPPPTTNDIQDQDVARFLPALVGLKNQAACLNPLNLQTCLAAGGIGYRGAHIIWDGLLDTHADCPYPKDSQGADVPADERGKPQYTNDHPEPPCRYNAYKFDAAKKRITPDWFASCIDTDNVFESDSLTFSKFNGTKGLEVVIAAATAKQDETAFAHVLGGLAASDLANFAASFDLGPHRCADAYGRNLPLLPPVVIPPFERSGDFDPAPSAEEVDRLCSNHPAGQVNFAAALRVNCPTLDQYQLFADATDPRSLPNGRGVPFSLNTKLFSDYTVKYRTLFLPDNSTAIYRDAASGNANTGIDFPVGTIISKTFAVADEGNGTERPIETRLIIKRQTSKGKVYWVGVPYRWENDGGTPVAKLALGGGSESISWNTTDIDSGVNHTGSTNNYLIPNGNQCLSCHGREDGEPGAVPIGLKVRFLNKAYRPESGFSASAHPITGKNQIAYWCDNGILSNCPANLAVDPQSQVAANLERIPTYNKPGDAGHSAGSDEDIEARARAWLEVNCQHCHNVRGFAASTGLYLDSLTRLNLPGNGLKYGICKSPTATGQEGSGGRSVDIHPQNVANSILAYRIGAGATTPAARMPPLARSVVDAEAVSLIENWIANVLVADESRYQNSTACP